MKNFNFLKDYLINLISKSSLPEDPSHAENTLFWLLKIYPQADLFLKISAIGHDIERAFPELRVKRENFDNYDEYKKAHAENSAKILKKILLNFNFSDSMINTIYNIVKHHEHGGDFYSNLLKDADSLSFFDNNIKFFYEREGFKKTLWRARWGFKRLSLKAKIFLRNISHDKEELNKIIELCQK